MRPGPARSSPAAWVQARHGDRLTFESANDAVRLRLVWDASDPSAIVWTNECSVADGPWSLIESYRLQPTG
jgi:hypothetical protein